MLTFKNKYDKTSAVFESAVMTQQVLILQENKNIYNTSEASVYKICRENFEVCKEFFENVTFPALIGESFKGGVDTLKALFAAFKQALTVIFQKIVVNLKAKIVELFKLQTSLKKYFEGKVKDIENGWVIAHSDKVKYKSVIDALSKIKLESLNADRNEVENAFDFRIETFMNAVTGGKVLGKDDVLSKIYLPEVYNEINKISLNDARKTMETVIFRKGKTEDNFIKSVKTTIASQFTRDYEDFNQFFHTAVTPPQVSESVSKDIQERFLAFTTLSAMADQAYQDLSEEDLEGTKLALDKMIKVVTLYTNALFVVKSAVLIYKTERTIAMQSVVKELYRIGTTDN